MFNAPSWQSVQDHQFGQQPSGLYLVRNNEKKQIATVHIDSHGFWQSPIIFDDFKRVDSLEGHDFVRWHTS